MQHEKINGELYVSPSTKTSHLEPGNGLPPHQSLFQHCGKHIFPRYHGHKTTHTLHAILHIPVVPCGAKKLHHFSFAITCVKTFYSEIIISIHVFQKIWNKMASKSSIDLEASLYSTLWKCSMRECVRHQCYISLNVIIIVSNI